jgi:hypothetical protein
MGIDFSCIFLNLENIPTNSTPLSVLLYIKYRNNNLTFLF